MLRCNRQLVSYSIISVISAEVNHFSLTRLVISHQDIITIQEFEKLK